MQKIILDCFCISESPSGNRAAVIINFNGGKLEKQEYAKHLNLPVTVYISDKDSDTPLVEYFYPNTEMPLCLHGTIAAGKVIFSQNGSDKCTFITSSNYKLNVNKSGSLIQVEVFKKPCPIIQIDKLTVCKMLNLHNDSLLDTNLPFTIASVGSPKLFIPVKSSDALFNLKPNFYLVKEWSITNLINGLFVYTTAPYGSEADFIARAFNPKTGFNEDAATGVAAAALALLLKKSLVILQGGHLGTPCKIFTTYVDDEHIFVGGNVVTL